MKISLVIPAYNEKNIIENTVGTAMSRLALIDPEYEIIVVDDGSTDGTLDRLRALEGAHLRLEGYSPNRGKGVAVRLGMLSAQGKYIFCTDADLAYGLEYILTMLRKLEETGCDLVIGSRRLDDQGYRDYPLIRLITSKSFALLVRLISGLPYDTQCGIKGYRCQAARALFSKCETEGFAYDFEILLRAQKAGMRIEQEAVSVVNHRDSKINLLQDSVSMFRALLSIKERVTRHGE